MKKKTDITRKLQNTPFEHVHKNSHKILTNQIKQHINKIIHHDQDLHHKYKDVSTYENQCNKPY